MPTFPASTDQLLPAASVSRECRSARGCHPLGPRLGLGDQGVVDGQL